MTVSLSLLAGAGWQFFDDNGTPLTGGLLYTYAAGTTTPVATYTDSTGATANANPIVLDAAGRVSQQVWLTVGSDYKFLLKTSTGVSVWSKDNIPGGMSSDDVSFLQAGTNAVTRTAQAKMRDFVDVRDFGASTAATATTNAAAINAAIQSSLTGEIRLAETYSINASINLNGFNGIIRFIGNGSGLQAAANNLKVFQSTTNAYGCKIIDARVIGTGYTGVYGFDLERFQLRGAELVRPVLLDCEYGIYLRSLCWALKIDHPDFDGTDYPITLVEGCNAIEINHPCIDNYGVVGIWIKDGGVLPNVGNLILNGFIQNGTEGIVDQGVQTQVIGTYFEGNSVADVSLKNASWNFYGCATNHTAGGVRAYRSASADAAMIVHPFMSSGARSVGLFDFDGTNTNCYYDVIFGAASRNLPLGITTGIQPLSNKPGPIGGVTPDSGAFTTLSASGVASLAGGANTAKGVVNSAASGVASTLFTLSGGNRGRYDIVAMIANSGAASLYTVSATAFWDGTQARIVASNTANMTLTLSGANVQATQSSGSANSISWSYLFTTIS